MKNEIKDIHLDFDGSGLSDKFGDPFLLETEAEMEVWKSFCPAHILDRFEQKKKKYQLWFFLVAVKRMAKVKALRLCKITASDNVGSQSYRVGNILRYQSNKELMEDMLAEERSKTTYERRLEELYHDSVMQKNTGAAMAILDKIEKERLKRQAAIEADVDEDDDDGLGI